MSNVRGRSVFLHVVLNVLDYFLLLRDEGWISKMGSRCVTLFLLAMIMSGSQCYSFYLYVHCSPAFQLASINLASAKYIPSLSEI